MKDEVTLEIKNYRKTDDELEIKSGRQKRRERRKKQRSRGSGITK